MSRVTLKTTHITMTPEIERYVYKRIETLEKHLGDGELIHVEIGQTTAHHKNGDIFRAEIRFMYAGKHLYAVSEKEDIFSAIDEAKDEMVRRVKSEKSRIHSHFREGAVRLKNMVKGFSWKKKK